jgi:hypothetical protein
MEMNCITNRAHVKTKQLRVWVFPVLSLQMGAGIALVALWLDYELDHKAFTKYENLQNSTLHGY